MLEKGLLVVVQKHISLRQASSQNTQSKGKRGRRSKRAGTPLLIAHHRASERSGMFGGRSSTPIGGVQIAGCRREVGVAEQRLHRAHVSTSRECAGRRAVPQIIRPQVFYAGALLPVAVLR